MTGQFTKREVSGLKDEQTTEAVRRRDEAAIGEVIKTYSKLLWKIASAVLDQVGSVQDVEECVADTFVYFWENPNKYDPQRGKLKTWLSIIARSKAIDRYRELSQNVTLSLEKGEFTDRLGVEDKILQQEREHTLFAALNRLEHGECDILLRRYYYDQKPREIALALDMSVKQVNNRLYQTKQKLRKELLE